MTATAHVVTELRKGLPSSFSRSNLDDLPGAGLSVLSDDLALPAAILKRSALENNSLWMRSFLEEANVKICPHGKTSLSPQLFRRQLEDGAWGITAATAHHVRLYSAMGVGRILMANQLIGDANIRLVLDILADQPELDFYCLIDSEEGVTQLAEIIKTHRIERPVKVLLEIGGVGARTGVRTIEAARALAFHCKAHSGQISLVGVEIFEGVYAPGPASYDKVEAIQHRLLEAAAAIEADGAFAVGHKIILTAGGSVFFDMSVEALHRFQLRSDVEFVIRSGCYLTHDQMHYERAFDHILERSPSLSKHGRLKPALEVWAHIQSMPEPGLVVASLGKRDISFDIHPPKPIHFSPRGNEDGLLPFPSNAKVKALYDQHAVIELDRDHNLQVGDLVGFGLSHPCTTFDKWKTIFVVDDDYRVVDTIETLF